MADLNKLARLKDLNAGLGGLAGKISDALDEMNSTKADKPVAVSATLPATGWKSDSTALYPFYYDLAVAGVTTADYARVSLPPSSIGTAITCGLCASNETVAGGIRFRAYGIPTKAMALEYTIEKGGA